MADLFGEFMNLAQPWQPPPDAAGKKGDKQPPAPTPDQLTQPSGAPFDQFMQMVKPAVQGAAKYTGAEAILKAKSSGLGAASIAGPVIEPFKQFMQLVQSPEGRGKLAGATGQVATGMAQHYFDVGKNLLYEPAKRFGEAATGQMAIQPEKPGQWSEADEFRRRSIDEQVASTTEKGVSAAAEVASMRVGPKDLGGLTSKLGSFGGKSDRAADLGKLEQAKGDTVKSAPKGMGWAEKIFSPGKRSVTAEESEGLIRQASGHAARTKAATMERLEPFRKVANGMDDAGRYGLIRYIENRSKGAKLFDPSLQGIADVLRDAVVSRRKELEALPSHAKMSFILDFFPHMFLDPGAARKFAQQFIGRMGSSASTNKRTIPTVDEALSYGIKLTTTDPIEIVARYITSMDHFIARTKILDTAKSNGTVVYPKAVTRGASGHSQGNLQLPEDLRPLNNVQDKMGNQAYAPEDWARVWNNYASQPWGGNADFSDIAGAMQRSANFLTAIELGFSGFHATTMSQEAIANEFARAWANLFSGRISDAFSAAIKAPAAPVRLYQLGKKGQDIYLDRSPGSPHNRELVDTLEKAGARFVGKSHASDYTYSAMGDFWTAFSRGALKQELREAAGRVTGPVTATKEIFSMFSRAMESLTYPLFVKYIPALKNGAGMQLLSDWLLAHPNATEAEKVAMGRRIWNSIDNRFGEMVQDNIFWNRTLKQLAQILLTSYSWDVGTIQEIGGGLTAFRHPVKALKSAGINSPDFNPKISYNMGLITSAAVVAMVYQYMKTPGWMPGQNIPTNPRDAHFPLTGGTVPGFGGHGEVPQRAVPPGYMPQVYSAWYNPWQTMMNKINIAPRIALQMVKGALTSPSFTGQDEVGREMSNPADPFYWRMADYFKWVAASQLPISARSLIQGEKRGSNIWWPEKMMGIREAPIHYEDPEGYERGMSKIYRERHRRDEFRKRRSERQHSN
jgi:hypothetical protein